MTTGIHVKVGDISAEVADVQARLRALGIDVADPPSEFGEATKRAVRVFQQQRGILVDGIVGPQTWRELVEASWRIGDRVLYLRHPPMRGDDVVELQSRLNALGFDVGRADGIFGIRADRAVRAFQHEYGVMEDGIFGPESLRALHGLRVERAGAAADLRDELRRSERSRISGATIVIDPGHGGAESGDISVAGAREGDLCWDLATRLAQRLSAMGAHVRLTRTEADAPDGSDRARVANDVDADVFLSIHLNTHSEPHAGGASTYYFGGSKAGADLAEHVQARLVGLGLKDCRSHARSYALLKETRMPAVLVEPCFISNPEEAKRLEDPAFRGAVASALAIALRDYFEAVAPSSSPR